MLFNSLEFIFAFVPITLTAYILIRRVSVEFAISFLVLASLFFYSYWNPASLLLLTASILFNYGLYLFVIHRPFDGAREWAPTVGVVFNLALILYYKYAHFILGDVLNLRVAGFEVPVLPLAISFFTFQQISFLLDRSHDEGSPIGLRDYACYVTFFPQLIAGPIVRHNEFLPQLRSQLPSVELFTVGVALFSVGLAKKVIIADTLSAWVGKGYASVDKLVMGDAWLLALSYTYQLYFDFSGYSDMAIGLGMMFGFALPVNFNSPYKAASISDFWRRWHMTLSSFLRDYLYRPLGGNRRGALRTYLNLLITMLLGGLWHGAGWTFVIWGGVHGLALAANRFWSGLNIRTPMAIAWLITFFFVVNAWVIFRAPDLRTALQIYSVAYGMSGTVSMGAWGQAANEILALRGDGSSYFPSGNGILPSTAAFAAPILLFAVLVLPNSMRIAELVAASEVGWKSLLAAVGCGVALTLAVKRLMEVGAPTEFLYFQF